MLQSRRPPLGNNNNEQHCPDMSSYQLPSCLPDFKHSYLSLTLRCHRHVSLHQHISLCTSYCLMLNAPGKAMATCSMNCWRLINLQAVPPQICLHSILAGCCRVVAANSEVMIACELCSDPKGESNGVVPQRCKPSRLLRKTCHQACIGNA